jgi:hypothetical protein
MGTWSVCYNKPNDNIIHDRIKRLPLYTKLTKQGNETIE